MTPLQIAMFRRRHRLMKSRTGVRCRCTWTPPAGTKAVDVARVALAHLQDEKAIIEQAVAS